MFEGENSDDDTDVEDLILLGRSLDDRRLKPFLGDTGETKAPGVVKDCGKLIRRTVLRALWGTPVDFTEADSASMFSASCKLMRREIFSGVLEDPGGLKNQDCSGAG